MPSSRGSSTQGLNPGLLHCRRILYHLSYQGSPASDPTTYQTTCPHQRGILLKLCATPPPQAPALCATQPSLAPYCWENVLIPSFGVEGTLLSLVSSGSLLQWRKHSPHPTSAANTTSSLP